MKADIVIPTTGAYNSIKRVLSSIEALDGSRLKNVILVFDSDDVTAGLDLKHPYLSLLVFKNPKKGVNAARNLGLAHADSEVVIFLDDDCEIVDKSFVNKHLEAHRFNDEAAAIGGGYKASSLKNVWSKVYSLVQQLWISQGQEPEGKNSHLLGGNVSYKKSVIAQFLFNEEIRFGGAETELHKRLADAGYPLVFHPDLLVNHHVRLSLFGFLKRAYLQGRSAGRYGLVSIERPVVTGQESLVLRELSESLSLRWAWYLYHQVYIMGAWVGLEKPFTRKAFNSLVSFFKSVRFKVKRRVQSLEAWIKYFLLFQARRTNIKGSSNKDFKRK